MEVFERNPLHGPFGRGMADAAGMISRLGRRSLVVSPICSSVPVSTIHDVALMLDRERVGRRSEPNRRRSRQPIGQSSEAERRDAQIRARGSWVAKRHIAVDTDGRLLTVNLTPADISDSAGAQMILDHVASAGRG